MYELLNDELDFPDLVAMFVAKEFDGDVLECVSIVVVSRRATVLH